MPEMCVKHRKVPSNNDAKNPGTNGKRQDEEAVELFVAELLKMLHSSKGWFNKEELENTPKRITRYLAELDSNTNFNFTTFKNPNYDQLIVLKDITFYSFCSHHLLPFYGRVHIGYLPDKRICGISKLSRVVKMYASKPQVQEQMTQEITNYLFKQLEPKFIMVVVEGKHLCMLMRGIKEKDSEMITSALKGDDRESLKAEFLEMIK